MQHDKWAMSPSTPIDSAIYSSMPMGASPVLPPGLKKTRCSGCGRTIILETANPIEMRWNPVPITGSDITIAQILGRELLKITGENIFIGYEHVLDDPDPHNRYLEAHDCLTAPIAQTKTSKNKQNAESRGTWEQGTL